MAVAIVTEFIIDYAEFVNLGHNMNARQIAETSKLILSYFPHLNLADLKLFFDKMKLGHYGKNYNAVDGQKILSFIEEYNNERMEEVSNLKYEVHKQQKEAEKTNVVFHPDVVEALKKAVGEKDHSKNFIQEKEVKKTKDQLLIERWTRQFDNLYRKYGILKGVRYLKINATLLPFDKFIELKFENYESNR